MPKSAAAIIAAALCLAASSAQAAPAPVATTAQGELTGTRTGAVTAFLGIPYAAPPVGTLRWRDPQPPAPWHGRRTATRFSPSCTQTIPAPWGPFTPEFIATTAVSENCLYLNVWTPARPGAKRPVYVWIHGGGFGGGSAAIPIYNGASLAKHGVVVVSINYRLGVFGFLALPELTQESPQHSSGNDGLLDMIAALKWVKANIAQFGGDPACVTIAGQSAGAAAVNDLVMSPAATGLFQRAIAESGSGMGINTQTLNDAERNGTELEARLHAPTLAALRALPAAQLEAATNVSPPSNGKFSPPKIIFAPNLDNAVIKGNPDDGGAAPASDVPFLTGYNADESLGGPTTPAEFAAMVRARYGAFADRLLALYPHATAAEVQASVPLLARDRYMASLLLWSRARAAAQHSPVYDYLYDHPFPPGAGKPWGAFHTAEVPYIFGALRVKGRSFTAADQAVSRQLQSHWIAFMQSASPATPDLAWPPITPTSTNVMDLGDSAGPRPAVSSPQRLAVFTDFVASGGRLSLF